MKNKFLTKLENEKNKKLVIRYSAAILSFIVVVVLVLFWTHSDFSTKDEKEVMRTTVGEFTYEPIKKVAYINDEYVSGGFPVKDSSLTLKSVSCTNGATATFDVDSWELKITNDVTKTRCSIYFIK